MTKRVPPRVVILGATSGIAEATARLYAAEGADLFLVARDPERLHSVAADLGLRGAPNVLTAVLDFTQAEPQEALRSFEERLGGIDHILLAYAVMIDQREAATSLSAAAMMIGVNYASAALWILASANLLEQQGHGSLVVLGSPAGDRGRRRNFIYGSTKAGLAVLVQGVAHRFAGQEPRAVLVKPAPTATAMTQGVGTPGRLVPVEAVAKAIRRAADRGGPIQYVPARWRLIMRIIREIPTPLFDRLDP
jgi:short-subunit dehydrogenase